MQGYLIAKTFISKRPDPVLVAAQHKPRVTNTPNAVYFLKVIPVPLWQYFELPLYSEADYIALRGLKQRHTEGSVHCENISQSEITHTHTLPG